MRSTRTPRVIAILVLIGAAALLPRAATASDTTDTSGVRATVRNVSGATIGSISIQSTSSGKLVVSGRFTGLSAGFHGFHIHSVGICNPRFVDPTGAVVPFGSAGAHLNPGGATHGSHAGDLPALLVAADGSALAVVQTGAVSLAQIFDADGAAFIVHALPDNLAHIPTRYSAAGVPGPDAATLATGDAGGRFGCGVITR